MTVVGIAAPDKAFCAFMASVIDPISILHSENKSFIFPPPSIKGYAEFHFYDNKKACGHSPQAFL